LTKLGHGPPLSSLIIGRERLLVTVLVLQKTFRDVPQALLETVQGVCGRSAGAMRDCEALQQDCKQQNPCQGCHPRKHVRSPLDRRELLALTDAAVTRHGFRPSYLTGVEAPRFAPNQVV
jgi:hypothetical protein